MPRFYCPVPLAEGASLALPPGAARHVQVLRLQPGEGLTLFNGEGGEYAATIERMGRSDVDVRIGAHTAVDRDAPRKVSLAVGMPANERMDWLVEKATELGVAAIQPLHTAHGVLRLSGERAGKKLAHWQAVAAAACEQCGRNRLPDVLPVQELNAWLTAQRAHPRYVLSLASGAQGVAHAFAAGPQGGPVTFLIGPEGGLSAAEEAAAIARGFLPVTLGTRVLRAETAALAVLAAAQLA